MRRYVILFLSLAAFALAAPGWASTAQKWEFAGWDGGGAYPAVVPDPRSPGRLYLLSDVAGMWKSDDRGNRWDFRNQGLTTLNIVTLAVAESNPNVVYIGTHVGMFRSDDAGANWRFLAATKDRILFMRPDNYRCLAVDAGDPDKVFAGTKAGEIYFSTNGGATFQNLGASMHPFDEETPVTALRLTRDGRYLLAGSRAGLFRYRFSDGAWQRIRLNDAPVLDIAGFREWTFVASGKSVAFSTDDGETWAYSRELPVLSASWTVNRITAGVDSSGTLEIAAAWRDGWRGGVYLSHDMGKSWKDIAKDLKPDVLSDPTRVWAQGFGWPLSLVFDPFDARVIYFSDFWGVWRSDDGGNSWTERVRGAPNNVGSDLVIRKDGTIFAAAMDDGLLKSTDHGVSYRPLAPANASEASVKGHVWRVLTAGRDGRHVVATNSPWNGPANQVLVSEDGGETFKKARAGLPAAYPKVNTVWDRGYARALAADPSNPDRIYLGVDGDDGGGFFFSDDGGYTWTRPEAQPNSLRIYNGLAVDPSNPQCLYWGSAGTSANGGIYRSMDAGQSWQKVFSVTGWVFDLAVDPAGKVYAATDSGGPALYASEDKGASWTLLKKFDGIGACEGLAIDPANPKRLAVSALRWEDSAGGRIFLSEDGGKNWSEITGDLPNGGGAAAAAFSPDGYLYIFRYGSSVYRTKL